ncbi:DedA family protein [[Clostridium] polysaccharolyticum]|uniref:Membrane protein DedA, SNARE-associated domain n=1 Tax=[Clostridium] polysaccharolyticum TaxID=29364 RepID=A0A1I0F7P4_9FIRM|nr:DedA family protein [[Clostridium] polysaccharolyticum]SET53284.1 membrane protein DedA, SNARE-associated domain [[Clostridium] polysaccharolyticum]
MDFFINLIYEYGLFAMFFLILIEYACFPVSSEIVLPFSGAVAASSGIHYPFILLASIAAGLIGTSICFFIGQKGGTLILLKIQKKFPKSQASFEKCYEKFQKQGTSFVCISRVIPLCRTYVAFVAGALNLKYSSFCIASFAGISVWNALLIGLGYTLGNNWEQVTYYYGKYKHIFIITVIVSLGSYLIYHLRNRKKNYT